MRSMRVKNQDQESRMVRLVADFYSLSPKQIPYSLGLQDLGPKD